MNFRNATLIFSAVCDDMDYQVHRKRIKRATTESSCNPKTQAELYCGLLEKRENFESLCEV